MAQACPPLKVSRGGWGEKYKGKDAMPCTDFSGTVGKSDRRRRVREPLTLKLFDGPLVQYAVKVLGLRMVGRGRGRDG